VAGRGVRRLRARRVAVRVGVLESECRDQHRGFVSVVERGRPWLALKLAATLDGRIATARGESRWISGARSRARVHALRASTDAILVGSATARADDPTLTARRGSRILHRPVRAEEHIDHLAREHQRVDRDAGLDTAFGGVGQQGAELGVDQTLAKVVQPHRVIALARAPTARAILWLRSVVLPESTAARPHQDEMHVPEQKKVVVYSGAG